MCGAVSVGEDVCRYLNRPEEGVGSLGAGVRDAKQPDVGAENRTLVPLEN